MLIMTFKEKLVDDPFSRYRRHKATIKQEGSGNGKTTIITNLNQIAKDVERDEKSIGSFLAKKLGTRFKIDSKTKRTIINGHFTSDEIDSLIQNFIETKVLCKICGNPETDSVQKVCRACGSSVDS